MSNLILLTLIVLVVNIAIGIIAYNCGYKDRTGMLQTEKDDSYAKGRDNGFTEGYKCGLTQGREFGQKEGRAEGFADGKIFGAQQSYNEEALRAMGLKFTNDKNISPRNKHFNNH